jgi:hypothetical protein
LSWRTAASCLAQVPGRTLEKTSKDVFLTHVTSRSLLPYRIAAPYSESSKEIAALGLLVSVAGFFSFSQNLVVDGFVTLPNIPLPSLPMPQGDGGVDYAAIMSMKDAATAAVPEPTDAPVL